MVEGTWVNWGRRRKLILTLLNGFTWTLFVTECNGLKMLAMPITTPRTSTSVEDIVQPPKITLLNKTSEYFGDISYRPNIPMGKPLFQNDTTYIVPNSRNFVLFECVADYPIFWNLAQSHIHPGVYHAVRVMSKRKWKDPFDPKTFIYVTLLSLDGPSPKLTSNYSCQSAARPNIQSNIFLFWESSIGSTFVHSKENLTIAASSADDVIQLPCQVTDPDSHPKLKMLIEQDKKDSYQDVHLNESIVYSPPVGYTLKNLPNPWGTYKCELDGSEFVSVRVLQKKENRLAQKSYIFDYDEKNNKVKCCNIGAGDGGRRKTPKIYMMDCQHPSTCGMREHLFVDAANYFWNQGRRRGNCSVFNLRTYHSGVLRCAGSGFDAYKEFTVPVETYELNWNEKRNSTTYFRWEEIDPQKMIVVSSSTKTTSSYDVYSYSLPRRRPAADHPNDEIIYSNQTVQLVCHTSHYYFASGVYWMLRWRNQTLTPITDDAKVMETLRHYPDHSKHLTVARFTAQPEMEAAICFAPVWNSSLWVPKIHYLYVNESIPPTIENPVEIVNYTWYANETGKILSCSASGLPAPTFQWQKDNITILPSTHNYNVLTPNVTEPSVVITTSTTTVAPTTTDSTTPPAFSPNSSAPDDGSNEEEEEEDEESYKGGTNNNRTRPAGATTHTSIVIARVSYSTHGVFRCVATNVGGIVLKEFHITVLEAKSWTVAGMLVGASIISIVLIAAIIYILQRLYQDRQEINRLAVASLSRSSSVNFNHETAGSNGSSRNGVNHGSGIREQRPSPFTSAWDTHTSSGIGNGRAEDGHNRSATFDNGIMTNNLIDTY